MLSSPSFFFFFPYLHTSCRKIHLKLELESNKPDIICNDKQEHFFKLALLSRNLSSATARKVSSAQHTNCWHLSLGTAQTVSGEGAWHHGS